MFRATLVVASAAIVGGTVASFILRPAARRQVWLEKTVPGEA